MIQVPKDVAAPPSEAIKTQSGIARIMLHENPEGETISAEDWVLLHYTGWTTDGKMFDSSKVSGTPVVFPLEQLIPGMSEALQLGRVGESMRVWIPEELAYKGIPNMPQGMLVFEFEILNRVTPEIPPLHPTEEATQLHDGLAYLVLSHDEAQSDPILPSDTVTLDFIGWSRETGKRFHSSVEFGEPLIAPVRQLFHGFRDVLVSIHKGDIAVVWVPQQYGIDPHGDELPGDLIFSMKVLDVQPQPAGLEAPSDVAQPPKDAEITATGLASKVLSPAKGSKHPQSASRVRVHYSGWTTDGNLFDSSIQRGNPAEFNLNQVIAGWTEGLQLMAEGEKRRFWIPEKLAYQGMDGAPKGMLVFDVELIAIV